MRTNIHNHVNIWMRLTTVNGQWVCHHQAIQSAIRMMTNAQFEVHQAFLKQFNSTVARTKQMKTKIREASNKIMMSNVTGGWRTEMDVADTNKYFFYRRIQSMFYELSMQYFRDWQYSRCSQCIWPSSTAHPLAQCALED